MTQTLEPCPTERELVARALAATGRVDWSIAKHEVGSITSAVALFDPPCSDQYADSRFGDYNIPSLRGVVAYADAAIAAMPTRTPSPDLTALTSEVERLKRLLEGRDAFIIKHGMFNELIAALEGDKALSPATIVEKAGE